MKSKITLPLLLILAVVHSAASVMDHEKMLRAYIAGDMDAWGA